ncbi:hypothetical protein Q7C36_010358 [Tachysurus vachellii]|uniref:Uncharacterized protein n=1 Tax=Tachysurus vachellii TaxID=175792 RepID=A0AA88MXI3_TACVA|nr:hypothetical protein Q7C36_010358 [Tachysurus vachellii]
MYRSKTPPRLKRNKCLFATEAPGDSMSDVRDMLLPMAAFQSCFFRDLSTQNRTWNKLLLSFNLLCSETLMATRGAMPCQM